MWVLLGALCSHRAASGLFPSEVFHGGACSTVPFVLKHTERMISNFTEIFCSLAPSVYAQSLLFRWRQCFSPLQYLLSGVPQLTAPPEVMPCLHKAVLLFFILPREERNANFQVILH